MDDDMASTSCEPDSTVELADTSNEEVECCSLDDKEDQAECSGTDFTVVVEEQCASTAQKRTPTAFNMWQPKTTEAWESNCWCKLAAALTKLLTLAPNQYKPLSYEEMYTCVYKSVCLGYQESLCDRLCHLVRSHLHTVANRLEKCSDAEFLTVVNDEMNQYARAMKGIVPIFSYMDRFYVALKMKTELAVILLEMFAEIVMDKNVSKVLRLLRAAQSQPFLVLPSIAANIIRLLYEINHKYSEVDRELFAGYMPNILPPSTVHDLPHMIDTTREMQDHLLNTGVDRGDQSRKRRPDGDDFNS